MLVDALAEESQPPMDVLVGYAGPYVLVDVVEIVEDFAYPVADFLNRNAWLGSGVHREESSPPRSRCRKASGSDARSDVVRRAYGASARVTAGEVAC